MDARPMAWYQEPRMTEYRIGSVRAPDALSIDPLTGTLTYTGYADSSHYLGENCIRHSNKWKTRRFVLPLEDVVAELRRVGVIPPAVEASGESSDPVAPFVSEDWTQSLSDSANFIEGSSD